MTHQSYYIQLEIRESKRSAVTISQCGSRRNHALNGQYQHIRSLLILKWNIWWICQSLVKHKSLTLYGLLLVWKAAYDDQSEERVPTLHCQLSASWDDIPEGSGLGQFYSPPPESKSPTHTAKFSKIYLLEMTRTKSSPSNVFLPSVNSSTKTNKDLRFPRNGGSCWARSYCACPNRILMKSWDLSIHWQLCAKAKFTDDFYRVILFSSIYTT